MLLVFFLFFFLLWGVSLSFSPSCVVSTSSLYASNGGDTQDKLSFEIVLYGPSIVSSLPTYVSLLDYGIKLDYLQRTHIDRSFLNFL